MASSEGAAKLPLAIRKDERDNEPKKTELLSKATAVVGKPVTFNFDLNAAYTNLAGNNYQARVVPISLNYLDSVIKAVELSCKDAMVKQELDNVWTSHNVALVVLTDDKAMEALKADKSTIGGGYFRLRFKDGELQVVTNTKYFNSNLSELANLNLTLLASAAASQSAASTPGAPDELPLELRIKMRDVQPKVDESLGRIRQLKGLEDASFNTEAQTLACYTKLKHITDRQKLFSPDAFPLYLDQLHALLTKQWKDDMVSEALLDEWKPPHTIELSPETDLENEKGAKVVKDGRYNGIKLEDGKLVMLQGKGMWKTNMNNIAGMDLVKMF